MTGPGQPTKEQLYSAHFYHLFRCIIGNCRWLKYIHWIFNNPLFPLHDCCHTNADTVTDTLCFESDTGAVCKEVQQRSYSCILWLGNPYRMLRPKTQHAGLPSESRHVIQRLAHRALSSQYQLLGVALNLPLQFIVVVVVGVVSIIGLMLLLPLLVYSFIYIVVFIFLIFGYSSLLCIVECVFLWSLCLMPVCKPDFLQENDWF